MFFENTLGLKQELGGTKIKQGDTGSILSFTLIDANGDQISDLNSKTATVALCDDNNIVYTKTTTVEDSIVKFNIDKAVQVGIYYLEIKIDNYIFPSDRNILISIEEGAVAYDLKDLVPNYDINMTLDSILQELNLKDASIIDLQTKMSSIYNNALSDHAEILNARGGQSSLDSRLDGLDAKDTDLQSQVNTNKTNISSIDSRLSTVVASSGSGKDSEVVDARTDEQGNVFNSLGDAVRNKVSMKPGKNLINPAKAKVGYYVYKGDGVEQADATYQYNKIFSTENTTYYLVPVSNIHIAFFNASGTFISGLVDPSSFVTPAGTKYFTVSYKTSVLGQVMLSKSPITSYEQFESGINGGEILKGTISGDKLLPELKIKVENAVSYVEGVNLINKDIAEVGFYRAYNTGNKVGQALFQINYITVVAGGNYYLNFASNVHIAFFNASGTYISGLIADTKTNPIVVPTNAVQMSVSYAISQKDAIVLAKTLVQEYVSHELGIDGTKINSKTIQYSSLSDELLESIKATKIIKVGPGQTYTSLLKAISENTATKNTYQLVNYVVDMKQEYLDHYGADFFTNYVDYSGNDFNKRGYNLKIGDNLIADPKSKIVWNYDASNVNVNTWFSPLNLTINNKVDGLDIDVVTDYSCRYLVHDDFAWDNNGKNHVSRCHFKGRSYFFQIVGAGMSTNSEYLYEDCKFEDSGNPVDPSNTKEQLAYTIHNNSKAGAKNNVKLKDCWTSQNLSIRATHYGQSTEISDFTVTNCKTKSVYTKAHTVDGTSPNVNVQLFDWNNPLWTE
ncbi:hypothetical protein A9Q68_08645 [Streptococcus bovimastitidis]|uniref:BppU N-terminal domain-containing protein n=1 Tax=Streptococcus bovimastitidis TaxID=1856638 RepID=A0A1L8MKJ2_9STRE|nr:hypothetical protein [Streptococcus bovimastitidis]OJF71256.1 hypothetical protein A9Q68_08645 [Streptococcus bovimastitidis]